MRRPTLDYGTRTRRDPRGLAVQWLLTAAVLAASLWAIRVVVQRVYYLDRDAVLAELTAIPGASRVSVAGFDDGPTFTVALADVHCPALAGSAPSRSRRRGGGSCAPAAACA